MPGPRPPGPIGPEPPSRREGGARRSPGPEPPGERVQKVLARTGFGSRRAAEELIREGRVRIGDRPATLGDRVDPARDRITVDGAPVPADPELRYFALNKPAGVTTTLRDRHATRTVASYLPAGARVYPVGRLDRETEGLLLLTNDGELANRIQHPRFGVEKEYLAEVEGLMPPAAARALTRGVHLDDGIARAVRAGPVTRGQGASALPLVMNEGRKREVRRMLAALNYPVRRLVRTRVGPVRLGRLAPGAVRPLALEEVRELYRLTRLQRAETGPPSARRRGGGRAKAGGRGHV